jgi:TRAP-type C4-dicarboxylate transport system permease small subunit
MDNLFKFIRKASIVAQSIAGATLAFMMVVTLSDITLRIFGKPLLGCYELISFSGGIVIGLAIPYTSVLKGHIYVDVFFDRSPRRKGAPINHKDIMNITTRLMGVALFLFVGWSFFMMGNSLMASKEVSQTLRLPFSPVAYGLGVSAYIQSALLFCDTVRIIGGSNE